MRRLVTIAVTTTFAASVVVSATWSEGGDAPLGVALPTRLVANLETFGDCDELRSYMEDTVAPRAPVGRDVGGGLMESAMPSTLDARADRRSVPGAAAVASEAAGAAGGDTRVAATSQAQEAFSQTNVQEAGVDEPDLVKTDGRLAVAVARGSLQVVDLTGGSPVLRGSLALPEGLHELFLAGERALVLTQAWGFGEGEAPAPLPDVAPGGRSQPAVAVVGNVPSTVVTAVDLSDPARPSVTATTRLEGEYVTARLADGIVRLVLRSGPEFRALEGEVDELGAWLPERIEEGSGGEETREPLVPCDAVARPPEPSGPGTTTVVTLEVDGSLDILDSDAVVADAQTVYASAGHLYVATNAWAAGGVPAGPPTEVTTELHAFDISSPTTTEYVGSGQVRGHLLNQWALSEHDGHLRVATTDGSPWADEPGAIPPSESFVTVLRLAGDHLEVVGQVGGLGLGERIYAVRYFGDVAFVVTFRQIDPLYALDLSDPTAPSVKGELKIPGYSSYLHPVGEGRLLGVGQDADDEGGILGTQVSLFDVSDLDAPRRLDGETIRGAWSSVEHDHRAFLWWSPAALAVVPVAMHGAPSPAGAEPGASDFTGVAGFTVSRDGIDAAGRVSHPSDRPPEGAGAAADAIAPEYAADPAIERALVVGDILYTLSESGLLASDLATFSSRGFARF